MTNRVRLEKQRIIGTEFDWFAVDGDGHIGHFATAGYGPVPAAVLTRMEDVQGLQERVLQLPIIGRAKRRPWASGDIENWLQLAKRGLFSYDFKSHSGPYRLVATPAQPLRVTELPEALSALIGLVVWPEVRFTKTQTIRPERVCPCE
jgi:hypothetical protein